MEQTPKADKETIRGALYELLYPESPKEKINQDVEKIWEARLMRLSGEKEEET